MHKTKLDEEHIYTHPLAVEGNGSRTKRKQVCMNELQRINTAIRLMYDGVEFVLYFRIPKVFLCSIKHGDVGIQVLLKLGDRRIHAVVVISAGRCVLFAENTNYTMGIKL